MPISCLTLLQPAAPLLRPAIEVLFPSPLQDMLISFLPHGSATYFHPPKLAYLIRLGVRPTR